MTLNLKTLAYFCDINGGTTNQANQQGQNQNNQTNEWQNGCWLLLNAMEW